MSTDPSLPAPTEAGALGVFQLKRLWAVALAARRGRRHRDLAELRLNHLVTDALGLGLEQVQQQLMQRVPTFEEFERWIIATTGGVEPEQIARINAVVAGGACPEPVRRRLAAIDALPPVQIGRAHV